MANQRTEKSPFKSRYGGGYISAAQYLTECLCYLIALQEKRELYDMFWKDDYWAKIYRRQIPGAIKLLKEYSAEAILEMMRDIKCRKIRSFHARSIFEHIVKDKQRALDLKQERGGDNTDECGDIMQKPKPRTTSSASIYSKLKGL